MSTHTYLFLHIYISGTYSDIMNSTGNIMDLCQLHRLYDVGAYRMRRSSVPLEVLEISIEVLLHCGHRRAVEHACGGMHVQDT